MIQWKKEPKILLKYIKALGLINGVKHYFLILKDMRELGYFKY